MTVYTPLERTILETRDWLIAQGVEVPFELKRRDPDEPGRERKEKMEDKLFAVVMRYFRRQRKGVREILERWYPERKVIAPPAPTDAEWDDLFNDPQFEAELKRILVQGSQDGVLLFSDMIPLDIDYTLVNTEAAAWANKYSGNLIKDLTKTSRASLRTAISSFVDTPGFTIRDVMNMLPFTEQRAMMVATTEITKAYAMADQMAGRALQKEFPDVQVVKTWFTNNDALVCPICGPNHMAQVLLDDEFPSGHEQPPAHPRCRCWRSTTTRIGGEEEQELDTIPYEKIGQFNREWGDEGISAVYKANDTTNIMDESGSVVVSIRGDNKGDILFTKFQDIHEQIIRTAYPSDNIDNYVRFNNRDNTLVTRVIYAGVDINDVTNNRLINKAVNNIEKALDRLHHLGLSKDTKVKIYSFMNGEPFEVNTTVKMLKVKGFLSNA